MKQWRVIGEAAVQVGRHFSSPLLLSITLSFRAGFTLEAQEGRLFSPLASHKSYANGGGRHEACP